MAPSATPAPSTPAPLPANFSQAQAKKAVDALLNHHEKVAAEKEKTELVPREEHVWLVVNTKRGSTRKRLMPVRVQLPHPPLPPPPASSVCLISKSPQRTYKDLLSDNKIKFINRVVGVEKLKGKFKPFEPRRQLLKEHDMFLCDEAVLDMMPGLLGKMFFQAKKQPIPVNMKRKDLRTELARAISSTYFHPTTGTSTSTRIATPGVTSASQTLENLLEAIPRVVGLIPDAWDNVLSIGIKTSESVLLPVWNAKLDERFKNGKKEEGDVAMEESDVELESEKVNTKGSSKLTLEKGADKVNLKEDKKGKDKTSKADKLAGKGEGKKVSSGTKKSKTSAIGVL
ncbi:hypothetical protein TREMEDRAFT_39479 [Tremella mesenterica DSM 1558]|uniref:uncharacterized protein n=1 Tax=Tremella mesenterica (strain ATCC 24925 / CBS 8224 / DSM 1558 / NBRC 9311 / NRRL Y-6157 / RJB 2259-6 / UBC 559-6) TaxID=578456 RepID=UPI0003F48E8C|nr:uncharacterized protein TREMEDRAFT_39479 [Tremella mesenterica DSM 1558]EIW68532.1 hypothetical protein TREMEDRAFT_39479 [Tremella mesenterica DSM 1558]